MFEHQNKTIMTYEEVLLNKRPKIKKTGFSIDKKDRNKSLFDFQNFVVYDKAIPNGRYAIFSGCGTGKTIMQLTWAKEVIKKTNGKVLILAPLGVKYQTIESGNEFKIPVSDYFLNQNDDILITNYDQIDNVDVSIFSGIVLDESGILKNELGKTRNKIISAFNDTPYKLACSATPSPNDPMEYGNHAEFLNICSRNEMLAMYFVHDGGETSKWRLKKHARADFYKWLSSWCVMFENPSDIGFDADGYDLPDLNLEEITIKTKRRSENTLFNETAVSATTFNKELRLTKVERMDEVAKIVNSSNEPFIIWIKQDEEGALLRKMIPEAVEVSGKDKSEVKESRLLGFANGDFRVLVTKTKIAGFGMNYQICRNQVFASLDFSFESLYQGIRRSYRFGQKQAVNIYLISTDTMGNVTSSINRKQNQFYEVLSEMKKYVNQREMKQDQFIASYDTESVSSDRYDIRRGDSTILIKDIPDNSIGLTITSTPFAELYTYSNHIEDMGNCRDYNEFFAQIDFLFKEMYRVTMDGRNVCLHCMDLPIQKGKEGFIGLRDFSGMLIQALEKVGFVYHSRITIWKDPVIEMQRTKALGLLHKQVKKDSTMSRVGIPDYILVFRKDGKRENPVKCEITVDDWQKFASPIWSFDDTLETYEMILPCLSKEQYMSIPEKYRNKLNSPVWDDINYSDTLQFRSARDGNDEKHICPLQLPTIDRLITLYSNEGDTVFDPFGGIMSTAYQAIKRNRKAKSFELKESYFEIGKSNITSLDNIQESLF